MPSVQEVGPMPLGIRQLAARYRSLELSPVSVIEGMLATARLFEPGVNAFATLAEEAAMRQAKEIEAALQKGESLPTLAGIPVTVKDNLPTAGIRTTFGSPRFAQFVPETDAASVGRLADAKAVILGKTTTPEFACRQTTSSALLGVSRNPLDLDLTPGGSSGGSSASIAMGIGSFSVVTDGGGSSRLPAACTGIVGFKPTLGRIPFDTVRDAFGGFAHIGLMARTIDDARVALGALEGPHPGDPYSLSAGPTASVPQRDSGNLAGLRVGWRPRRESEVVDHRMLAVVERFLKMLEDAGAIVEELRGEVSPPLPVWRTLQHLNWLERFGSDRMFLETADPVILAGIEQARSVSALEGWRANVGRTQLFRTVQGWLSRCDLIVSPTLARLPLPAEHPGYGDIEIAGASAGDIREAWAPLLGLFTMTGHPSLTLNCGWVGHLPVGVHLVTRWGDDHRLLDIAEECERVLALDDLPRPRSGVFAPI